MSARLHAALAVALLVAFPFVVLAVGFAVVLTGAWIGGRAAVYLALLAVGLVIALGYAVVSALRMKLEPPHGPRLTRAEQPDLWRVVDELADQVGTRPPDEIVLVAEVNAAVTEDSRLLGLRPGRRYLMIGLPLLAGLTAGELRAVLAHELGHYGGGHTRLLEINYRGTQTLERTVDRLDSGISQLVLGGYVRLYLLVAGSANRAQELQADQSMVAASGRDVAASALRKIATLDLAWASFNERYVALAGPAGRTPELLLGFHAFLDHPTQRRWLTEIADRVLDEEPTSRFDSHPPIRRRLAVLAAHADTPAPPDERHAWALLRDPHDTVPAVERSLLVDGLGPRADWAEIARLAGAEMAGHGAELLAKAAVDSGVAPNGTLGEVLTALRQGHADRFDDLHELLADTVVAALVEAGRAHHELNWGGPWQVRLSTGDLLDVDALVEPAVADPAAVEELTVRLIALGVPGGFVRPPREREVVAPRPTVVGVLSCLELRRMVCDLVVYGHGMLLSRVSRWVLVRRQFAGLIGMSEQSDRKRIGALVELPLEELRSRPRSRWIETEDLAGGEFTKRFSVTSIRLRLVSGEELQLKISNFVVDYFDTRELLTALFEKPVGDTASRR